MSIDITKVSSLLNQLSNTPTSTKTNNYSVEFAEYLMNSMTSQKNTTTVNDLSSVFPVNINNTSTISSTIEQALKSNPTTDITQLLNLYSNQQNTNSNVWGGNSSSSLAWNDLFTTQSSQTAALQTLYSSSSSTDNTITDALQSNFLSKQMNIMQTAYNKLHTNLEDYKERNVGIDTEAVKNRINEMTKNVTTLHTYMQEKLAEKATNESLVNQLNANSQLASLNFK